MTEQEEYGDLNPELESKIRNVFDLHDIEQNESILRSEVLKAFKLIPALKEIPPELEERINNDIHSDTLSWREFRDLAVLTINAINGAEDDEDEEEEKEQLKNAFRVLARKSKKNKNKKDEELCVDFAMVKNLLKQMSGGELPLPEAEMDALIKEADKDNSGTIEIDEFVDFMMGE